MTCINHIVRQSFSEIILLVLLGIVFFSSINQTHDWGGDFAQYLDNARDLISGSEDQSKEVLDGINFAPATRGAGFSLLLSPVFLVLGKKISYFTIYISFFFLVAAFVIFKSYQKSGLSTALAFLLTLMFALNPEVFKLKLEILPSFPFLALLYLIFLNFQGKQRKGLVILAILTGILISIRNVGWVTYLAILAHLFVPWIRKPKITAFLNMSGFALIVPIVDLAIKWLVFGSSSSDNLSWYSHAFHLDNWSVLWVRMLYYYDQLLTFFKPSLLGVSGLIVGKMMIVLMFMGWVYRIYQKQWTLGDTFTLGYGIVLILYEGVSGIRFLIPVLPVILIYWVNGIRLIVLKLDEALFDKIRIVAVTTFLLVCLPGTWTIFLNSRTPIPGPDIPSSQEAFTYVQNTLSVHEATVFHKPWVLHYYTGRTSMAINPKNGKEGLSMDYLVDKMTRFKVNHLLVSIDSEDLAIYNEKLVREIQDDSRFTERWRNDAFVFLTLNEHVGNKKSTLK